MMRPDRRNPFSPTQIVELAKLRDRWQEREKRGGPQLFTVTDLVGGEVCQRPLRLSEALVTFERAAKRKLDGTQDWDLTGLDGLGL